MLSIHNVSIMMCMFYIDWQQNWDSDWILNIGANAHGKRTVSTKQPQHKRQTWQSGFHWHRRDLCIEQFELVLVTRLFHSATNFGCYMYLLFEPSPDFFFFFFFLGGGGGGGVGALSPVEFTIWWRILISRPPRVFSAFHTSLLYLITNDTH